MILLRDVKIVEIRRDPFARHTLVRQCVPTSERRACLECGHRTARFVYGTERDAASPHVSWHLSYRDQQRGDRRFPAQFCNVRCHDFYYNS